MACNKRSPGSGCSAIHGDNRTLAILGTSEDCIATNPSDMNVALTALEAIIHIQGAKGERDVSISDFFLVPGNTPQRENVLEPGDLITNVTVPAPRPKTNQVYIKLRDRASYEFALSSAAIVAEVTYGKFTFVRVALGGVGTKPWRSLEAEEALHNKTADEKTFHQAAEAALHGAHPQSENGFKVELAKRCITHALTLVTKSA
jgi:xanthine dehydrogenase YagS FAD-binding subunit